MTILPSDNVIGCDEDTGADDYPIFENIIGMWWRLKGQCHKNFVLTETVGKF